MKARNQSTTNFYKVLIQDETFRATKQKILNESYKDFDIKTPAIVLEIDKDEKAKRAELKKQTLQKIKSIKFIKPKRKTLRIGYKAKSSIDSNTKDGVFLTSLGIKDQTNSGYEKVKLS